MTDSTRPQSTTNETVEPRALDLDGVPPWPSEPPVVPDANAGDRTSGLVRSREPDAAELEELVAALERERALDAERMATLRESSLVQIRRLAALEREIDSAKNALASASAERDALRTRVNVLETETTELRDELRAANYRAQKTAEVLNGIARAIAEAGGRTDGESGPALG